MEEGEGETDERREVNNDRREERREREGER